jgi:hypothetical protein
MASFKDRAATKLGLAALNKGKQHELDASSTAAVVKGYIGAGFVPDDAEHILNWINRAVAEARKAKSGITIAAATITAPRVSETRGLLKLREWACWPTFMDHMVALNVSMAMLVKVGTWLRKKSGVEKKGGVCPSRETLLKIINAKQPKARTRKPKTTLQQVKADPLAAVDDVASTLAALAKVNGNADGAAFINAMCKAAASYRVILAKRIKAEEAAAAAEAE